MSIAATLSVMPSSWKVSTTSSASPSTSRKWPNAIRSLYRRMASGTSQKSAKFPWQRQIAFASLSMYAIALSFNTVESHGRSPELFHSPSERRSSFEIAPSTPTWRRIVQNGLT